MAKCSHCNGKPNVIRVFPNLPLDAYAEAPAGAMSPYRGPTHCPFCHNTGQEPDVAAPPCFCAGFRDDKTPDPANTHHRTDHCGSGFCWVCAKGGPYAD